MMSQESIRIAARNELVALQIELCKTRKPQMGHAVRVIYPHPDYWWLIQTTNVPSEGLTMDIDYSVQLSECCCRVDYDVSYRWLDLADIHPDRHWPDSWMAWLPGTEFWIHICWRAKATFVRPLTEDACKSLDVGWPNKET